MTIHDETFDEWLRDSSAALTSSVAGTLDVAGLLNRIRRRRSPAVDAGAVNEPVSVTETGFGRLALVPGVPYAAPEIKGIVLAMAAGGESHHHSAEIPARSQHPSPVRPDLRLVPGGQSEDGDGIDKLATEAVAGDRTAMGLLLAVIQPVVVRYCQARLGRQPSCYISADDVAQEACLAVLTALPSYRSQGRPFLAFVYGIAAHKVEDAHRSMARRREMPVAEIPECADLTVAGPEQNAMSREFDGRLARLLAALSPMQREIVVLRVVVGLSAAETAAMLGVREGWVRLMQHRALVKLRVALTK